jgi:hypothetical protein
MPLESSAVKVAGGVGMRQELDMRAAARIISAWRTEEHRGFAWWMLGNYYFRKSLVSTTSRRGYITCATKAYKAAASYVRPKENPELFAAIHNNYAGLLLFRRFTGFGKVTLRRIWKSLRYAGIATPLRGAYDAAPETFVPLQANIKRIANLRKQGSKSRVRRKKKRTTERVDRAALPKQSRKAKKHRQG